MMPVSVDPSHNQNDSVNYKKKYKALKRKLRLLVYEQECFTEELKKSQRKLLKVSRDKSFLLDRLLHYERVDDSSSDSEATASSESETEGGRENSGSKKKKGTPSPALSLPASSLLGSMGFSSLLATQAQLSSSSAGTSSGEPARKKAKVAKKKGAKSDADGPGGSGNISAGQMTREELERHLELKQSTKPQFMSLEKAPHSLPDDIFSHENSNQDMF